MHGSRDSFRTFSYGTIPKSTGILFRRMRNRTTIYAMLLVQIILDRQGRFLFLLLGLHLAKFERTTRVTVTMLTSVAGSKIYGGGPLNPRQLQLHRAVR